MSRIRFHDAADLEGEEAIVWYEQQEPGLGIRFRTAVETVVDRIQQNPNAYPIVFGSSIRQALVHEFPFVVIYTIAADHVIILAIFHTSRNPIIWQGRTD